MSVFILENLSKTFVTNKKENCVLKDINLALPDKGLLSIVGKSGCGKSTLLNILMGIEKPTKGKIYFKGQDLSKLKDKKFSEYHLKGVSLVFQHYNLFNDLTAFENVSLQLEIAGKSKKEINQKVNELFRRFNIVNLAGRTVNSLSGGEKQRIAILRSLVTDPAAILCDEPTGALDSENSREIMGILREISKNKLVVMVSHNKELVNEFSDYILTLKNGEILNNDFKIESTKSSDLEETKIHYSNKWINKFFKINFNRNLKKNIFSLIACVLSFAAMFVSVGFSEGSKLSQEAALKQNLGIGFATATESEFIKIEGSPLSYEKTVRPETTLIDKYFGDFSSIKCEQNISYFISNYPTCYIGDKKLTNFEIIPIYDPSLETFGKNLLKEGRAANGDFEEIIVNEEFAEQVGENALDTILTITNIAPTNYKTGDEELPFIKDTLNLSKKFKIVGIIHEFSFLNTPKIYYSYKGAVSYLKSEVMENVSNYLGKRTTYFDYLENCASDDPVSSYSSYVFITKESEIDNFFDKVNQIKEEPLQITSIALQTKETYSTFINSFSSTLIVFVIIAFLGINFILGMISLSTFLDNRKNTAILTCLGSRNSSIYKMYLSENYLVIILSYFLSIFLAYFLQLKLNPIILEKFGLENLIKIPFLSFYNIPFGLLILLLLIAIICSTVFTLVPMKIYRQNSITNELRDE